jgi:hypothetical protein
MRGCSAWYAERQVEEAEPSGRNVIGPCLRKPRGGQPIVPSGQFGCPQESQLDGKGNYGFVYHLDEAARAKEKGPD